ncbi:hypothetical protein CLU79DRAFT_791848 [Phycomyces nitens]|nr:hypothetical protein CLU79DRAFT_791848 [Phycomyces nitens]
MHFAVDKRGPSPRQSLRSGKSMAIMQKSRSEPNCASSAANSFALTIAHAHPKRKSTGNLRRTSSFSNSAKSTDSRSTCLKDIWRPPGCYEIPDILGNAYLKPSPPVALSLRPNDPSKQVTKVTAYFQPLYHLHSFRSFDYKLIKFTIYIYIYSPLQWQQAYLCILIQFLF